MLQWWRATRRLMPWTAPRPSPTSYGPRRGHGGAREGRPVAGEPGGRAAPGGGEGRRQDGAPL
eukprot:2877681-Pyramimonas_sp.AAC.1